MTRGGGYTKDTGCVNHPHDSKSTINIYLCTIQDLSTPRSQDLQSHSRNLEN